EDEAMLAGLLSFPLQEEVSTPGRALTAAETHIIFDWDDTLCPSSFIADVMRMYAPKSAAPGLVKGPLRSRRGMPRRPPTPSLPKDFPCYAALERHAGLVERLLRAAREHAGRVAIVTLAERPWVFESAEQYLPGLNLADLLEELQIPVYYAQEHTQTASLKLAGVQHKDECINFKSNAMAEFLQLNDSSNSTRSLSGILNRDGYFNLLSVGDSYIEQEAARATYKAVATDRDNLSWCKTVKLMVDPSLKQLSDELESLLQNLGTVSSQQEDIDVEVLTPEDLKQQLEKLSVSSP
ncbi:unnamed protein product, partial [Polarella glacialis]